MFEQIKPANQTNQPVEDIFSTTEKPPAGQTPPSFQPPIKPVTPETSPFGPTQPLTSLKDIQGLPEKKKSSFFPIILIIVLVIVLGGLGYLAYSKFFASQFQNVNQQPPTANQNQNLPPSNINQPVVTPPVINTNENENLNQTIDSDHDGLTDQEEATLGTNPNEVDTDGDNLYDYEEARVYKTNPLNPDSDNDGYLDGEEMLNGYNPLGPGKLLPNP